jgi:hypothetical protein
LCILPISRIPSISAICPYRLYRNDGAAFGW